MDFINVTGFVEKYYLNLRNLNKETLPNTKKHGSGTQR